MYFVKWENIHIRKVVCVPNNYTAEMVANEYGGNAEHWEIVVCK